MPARALSRVLQLALPTLLFLACAKGPPSGGVGTYLGVAASTTEIGLMEVTVAESDKGPLPATGTVKFPSKLITLTGTLDKSKTQLVLTSSDGYTMVAESRPDYALGRYMNTADEADQGSFALLLQADAPIESFCGSFSNTTATEEFTYPLAITAAPGGQAICVGPNFTWLGSLGTDDSLNCASNGGGGSFDGQVNSTGNPWSTIDHKGTWGVTSCANGADGDGGVPDGDPGDTAAQ